MSTLSAISKLPLPAHTDVIDANTTYGGYAQRIDSLLVPKYASTAARDAANASGATEGQACIVAEDATGAKLNVYDGTTWNMLDDTLYVVKPALTARVSTITPTADPHLTITVNAPGIFLFEAYLAWQSTVATNGYRSTWIIGGTATNKTEQFRTAISNAGATSTPLVTNLAEQVLVGGDLLCNSYVPPTANFGSAQWLKLFVDTTGSTPGQTLTA